MGRKSYAAEICSPDQFAQLDPERRLYVACNILRIFADLTFVGEGFLNIPAQAAPATAEMPDTRRIIAGAVGYYRPQFGTVAGDYQYEPRIARHSTLRVWAEAGLVFEDEKRPTTHKLGDVELVPSERGGQRFEPVFTKPGEPKPPILRISPDSLRAQAMTRLVYNATHRLLEQTWHLSEEAREAFRQSRLRCSHNAAGSERLKAPRGRTVVAAAAAAQPSAAYNV